MTRRMLHKWREFKTRLLSDLERAATASGRTVEFSRLKQLFAMFLKEVHRRPDRPRVAHFQHHPREEIEAFVRSKSTFLGENYE